MNHETRHIELAYFEKKSTVDYLGLADGAAFAFDAKECAQKSFSLGNVHEHQVKFMHDFIKQGGAAFLLVQFTERGESFLLPFSVLYKFWNNAKSGGRKSIP